MRVRLQYSTPRNNLIFKNKYNDIQHARTTTPTSCAPSPIPLSFQQKKVGLLLSFRFNWSIISGATYSCTYDSMTASGPPPVVPVCDLTCPVRALPCRSIDYSNLRVSLNSSRIFLNSAVSSISSVRTSILHPGVVSMIFDDVIVST